MNFTINYAGHPKITASLEINFCIGYEAQAVPRVCSLPSCSVITFKLEYTKRIFIQIRQRALQI
jgi:hypothetical protein